MIGVMIKVCALDFLNREFFETDVMTADGRVLFSSGDTITPNIILRLYFKDIYIQEPETATIEEKEVTIDFEHKEIISSSPVINDESKGPRFIDVTAPVAKEESGRGPRLAEFATSSIAEKEDVDLVVAANVPTENVEIEIENPEDAPLKFDEKQAKVLVEHSTKMGKLLNFNEKELKDLEQVAYYCNIGITKFKKADLAKKEFRKMKAFASYEHIINEGVASQKIAEMVKLCANNYESESFPLDSKIPPPYHSIVAITSYYEDMLAQNKSKQETLLKMLQLGGNQFNIFILHKFIKMMRDTND